jgi:hypothetical protein
MGLFFFQTQRLCASLTARLNTMERAYSTVPIGHEYRTRDITAKSAMDNPDSLHPNRERQFSQTTEKSITSASKAARIFLWATESCIK